MSAPLITRLFGPASNVQTAYYNLVNAPLAIAMGLLLGLAPLMRWRQHEPSALMRAALPSVAVATVATLAAVFAGVREWIPALVIFGAAFALTSNAVVTVRGFRSGWKHGVAYLGHMGVSVLLIGIVASSHYGNAVQVQLPRGVQRFALGFGMTYQGIQKQENGKDRVMIAVQAPGRTFEAQPALYWSAYNQGYMKKPHIERFITHDIYISPLEMVGDDPNQNAVWFAKGETRQVGQDKYTFVGFDIQNMGTPQMSIAAKLRVESGGRTVYSRPKIEIASGALNRIPDYLPGGRSIEMASADPNTGKVALILPGTATHSNQEVLAVEVSTKPLINLVWIGAVLMLASVFMSAIRRLLELQRTPAAPGAAKGAA
jgi:cytochrome c-type biogenesis protein CcmF